MAEEMSKTFQIAFSLAEYNPKQAIELYNQELQENPKNYAAWQNMGLCKLKIAIDTKDKELLEESKTDLRKAIQLSKEGGVSEFIIAEKNLKWAEETTFD